MNSITVMADKYFGIGGDIVISIKYAHSSEAWGNSVGYFEELAISTGAKRILEVGGGANPTFSLEFIAQHGLEYTVLDILRKN